LHAYGGYRYVYRLSIVRAEPDFSLKVAADSFVVTPGKPVEIPVTVDRLNGHAAEVEIVAEGLPEGVTASPVKSAGTGDSAKSVKLSLSAAAGPVAGPFRIVGRSAGDVQVSRTAGAAIANMNASIDELWLTILKGP
jgi:hypothetical protein